MTAQKPSVRCSTVPLPERNVRGGGVIQQTGSWRRSRANSVWGGPSR
ncbi:MAG: hypothetical protein AVDCRST_MAG66-3803 [uncultured Pseudonocardia sp.]|uniref:Uncharacterized protein n=1 Tax=uncultured Pseudonocardia sp. TaxID=211455 RepID=A0A6J4QAH8_9PSEU|nr:MAG: hypothetical protein AVDCRST_MAG66-3803 [uncultured Pseudonocardia sp.]